MRHWESHVIYQNLKRLVCSFELIVITSIDKICLSVMENDHDVSGL